jgi:hypothetical protein
MEKRALQSVLVTVDDQHHDLDLVARALEKAGLVDTDVLRFSGIIGGSISEAQIAGLREIPGVENVEAQPVFHAS